LSNARFRYDGTGGSLFVLQLINVLLTIVTLGIYSFWAKNKLRIFHYEHTALDDERFEYHGTGGELLIGALKGFAIIAILSLAFGIVSAIVGRTESFTIQSTLFVVFYLGCGVLLVLAVHGARRYRLSRSSWRTVRFSYHADMGRYAVMMIRGILLTILTLGFYGPYFANIRREFLARNTRFGSEPFAYDGDARPLFVQYVKSLLLTIPTLGLCWIWYMAFKHRHFWNNTSFGELRLQSSVAGGELFMLFLTNILLAVFTLGIGTPWVITRTKAFYCENMWAQGAIDWATILQRMQPATATGEGLAQVMDIDVGIGM
jgi:uncharacterized membrane protein YjgN (DUF898 family)